MARRTLKLAVVKADGTTEEYLHTKVVGAIANALGAAGQPDITTAEELAEAVTFFLYHTGTHPTSRSISTSEVLSVIETVLASTGYEEAAVSLSEHHFERKLRRCRVEVVSGLLHELADAEKLYKDGTECARSRWDKSRIVDDLVARHGLSRQAARTVASMVEEKVFNMGLSIVPAGLVRQLVLSDAAAVIYAEQQLQTV
jgi:transcriptional regulator NrdR family protein